MSIGLGELSGYAISLAQGTVLVDPPAPEQDNWSNLDALKPIKKIVLTNRDHVRDVEVFRARYGAGLIVGAHEVGQLAPVTIDETVLEDDLVGGALRVIDLPGKSPGEIGLYFEPDRHPVSRRLGGIHFSATQSSATRPAVSGSFPSTSWMMQPNSSFPCASCSLSILTSFCYATESPSSTVRNENWSSS